jgi:protein-S-isoprenylcysteine O-methyltransferase Ste14
MDKNPSPSLWSGQFLHLVALVVLLGLTWVLWTKIVRPFPFLFWLSISVPIAHQVFVWVTWRIELKSQAVTNSIGIKMYLVIFFILLISRPIAFLLLAWADRESLGLDIIARTIISAAFLLPAVYTMYSVKNYFGFVRAAGADHFDEKYRKMPLVKKGMFKYSTNSMYVFGFLMFWGFAIAFDSKAALLAGAFGHAYIWVHYLATEKPDMNYLYGERAQ